MFTHTRRYVCVCICVHICIYIYINQGISVFKPYAFLLDPKTMIISRFAVLLEPPECDVHNVCRHVKMEIVTTSSRKTQGKSSHGLSS